MTCLDCGAEFDWTENDLKKQDERRAAGQVYALPRRCARCRFERRAAVTLTCDQCGQGFETNEAQRRFAASRGRMPPCASCR